MGRKRVKYELIPNESTRKVTFRKRKTGLLKKVKELTTLCGISACAIIYNPFNAGHPEIWPSRRGAMKVLEKLRSLSPKKQGKYMLDQNDLLNKSILKMKEKQEKQIKKNHELVIELSLANRSTKTSEGYMNDAEHLGKMVELLQEKIDDVVRMIEEVELS